MVIVTSVSLGLEVSVPHPFCTALGFTVEMLIRTVLVEIILDGTSPAVRVIPAGKKVSELMV